MTIKNLEEYTQEELICLTEEQITKVIRLEQAKAGVKILYKPEPIGDEPAIKKAVKVYAVNSPWGYHNTLFNTLDSAEAFAHFLNFYHEHILEEKYYGSNYEYKWVQNKSINYISVQTEYYYEEEEVSNLNVELKQYLEVKKQYDKEMDDFRQNEKLVDDIAKWVHSTINEAKEEKRFTDNLISIFAEYKEIANNDQFIAQTFMLKAYPELTKEQQRILGFVEEVQLAKENN
jgi:hypothetical protein